MMTVCSGLLQTTPPPQNMSYHACCCKNVQLSLRFINYQHCSFLSFKFKPQCLDRRVANNILIITLTQLQSVVSDWERLAVSWSLVGGCLPLVNWTDTDCPTLKVEVVPVLR